MTIKDEALAELATNPRAKLFICSVPCKRCGGHERYIATQYCTKCQQSKNRASRPVRADEVNRASAKRMERAVTMYTTTSLSLGEVASIAGVGSHRLSTELKRRGVKLRHRKPKDLSKPAIDPRQPEFDEAKPAMLATKLFNDWYRSVHG